MDNLVIQATLGTRHTTEKNKEETQNGQSGDTDHIGYKTHNRENQRGKPRMDNLVIQATLSTRHTAQKAKGTNPEWTIW
jgi:hypothetical protein